MVASGEEGFSGRGNFPQGVASSFQVGGTVAEIRAKGDADAGHVSVYEVLQLGYAVLLHPCIRAGDGSGGNDDRALGPEELDDKKFRRFLGTEKFVSVVQIADFGAIDLFHSEAGEVA